MVKIAFEMKLKMAWKWKIRKRKGIGKCKNLKSYFWKLPKNWFIYVGIRNYILNHIYA